MHSVILKAIVFLGKCLLYLSSFSDQRSLKGAGFVEKLMGRKLKLMRA